MRPADLGLPPKFREWRPYQAETASKVADSSKFATLVDAPTGCGKTLQAVAAAKLLSNKAVYVVRTKQLQEQILSDFPEAVLLKGRQNYPCEKTRRMFPKVTAEDCTDTKSNPCDVKGDCDYLAAKRRALSAPITVLNQAYFLAESNYVGGFGDIPFLVLDESDTIEHALMNFVQLVVTEKVLNRLNVNPPRYKTKFESWVEWGEQAKQVVSNNLAAIEDDLPDDDGWETIDYNLLRKRKELERLYKRLDFFARNVDKNWVWYPEEDRWTFKPVWVSKYANSALWKHAKKVLGMSATILDPRQFASNVGLKEGDYEYLALPSLFPVESRQIHYRPLASITRKTKTWSYLKLAEGICKILDEHPKEKALVHCVSHELARFLFDNIKSKRLLSHDTVNRADKLAEFKKSSKPLVLLSPSMERGVDLPDEECRLIIVAKLPFPNIGDPQVSKRLYGSKDGKKWYAYQTAQSLVQSTGRATRSATDWSVIYILDAEFERFYSGNNGLLPDWWLAALVK